MTGICSKHRGYDSDCDLCNVPTDQTDDDRVRLGVTCDCLGPPYYVCPHWPVEQS